MPKISSFFTGRLLVSFLAHVSLGSTSNLDIKSFTISTRFSVSCFSSTPFLHCAFTDVVGLTLVIHTIFPFLFLCFYWCFFNNMYFGICFLVTRLCRMGGTFKKSVSSIGYVYLDSLYGAPDGGSWNEHFLPLV